VLLTLGAEGALSVTGADSLAFEDVPTEGRRVLTVDPLQATDDTLRIGAALLTSTSESDKILLITNEFKLTLVPAKSILVAQKIGAKGIHDLLRLQPEEYVTAMTLWNPARSAAVRRFICLVTRNGQVRRFEAGLLAGELQQAPYFKLERKYKDKAAHLIEADEEGDLILGTGAGRIVRIPVHELGNVTHQVLKSRPGEQVTAAAYAEPKSDLITVSQSGAALRLAASGAKSRTWKDARIVGFVSRQDVNRVLALTAQGLACPLVLPRVRFSRTDVVLLAEDDKVVSLLFLAA
jgi:DNA gyrase/topoisomerase IV subunit A